MLIQHIRYLYQDNNIDKIYNIFVEEVFPVKYRSIQ